MLTERQEWRKKMKKADYIIGIDPDTDKSGVAQLRVAGREMEVFSLSFPHCWIICNE